MHAQVDSAFGYVFHARVCATLLLVLALFGAVPVQAGEFASVLSIGTPGTWPGGKITWYYNPAGRPADIADSEIIDTVKAAFAEWNRVCQVEGTYAGLTTTPVDPIPTNVFVVGYKDLGSPQFQALGYHWAASGTAYYAPFTGGVVQINVASPDVRDRLSAGTFVGTLQHEIGHVLGLSHSDDPHSIMFANPYHTSQYMTQMQGDDISACADLYGGRGMLAKQDLRSGAISSTYKVQANVLATVPVLAVPSASLAQIDTLGGGPYYFDGHWQQLPLGTSVQRQWVTPDGSIYATTSGFPSAFVNGYNYVTFPDSGYRFPFAGIWSFQILMNGQLAARVPFDVIRGTVAEVAQFEGAVVGERDASGNLNWRVAAYGNGAPTKVRVVVNGQGTTATTTPVQTGSSSAEVWIETNRPRYKPDQTDGQPLHSYDVMRRISFSAGTDGSLLPSGLSVRESGTPNAYAANATLIVSTVSDYGIYVAASVGGRLYFRLPAGWSDQASPLATARGPAVAAVDILRNFDTRLLPAGTSLYVGYGRDLNEVVARGQYALVRQF